MSSDAADDLLFKGLADSRRRRILDLLKSGPRTTGELCKRFKGLDRCTVMQHIGVLERAGLIIVRREGRERWNYLNVTPFKEIYDRWISSYAGEAVELLSRLKQNLEGA
ncbi:MAG: ArsR/SmtB family transcription factor [Steroidobacteraceae bacterium]